jgi:hypothetical protein
MMRITPDFPRGWNLLHVNNILLKKRKKSNLFPGAPVPLPAEAVEFLYIHALISEDTTYIFLYNIITFIP